jgi:hypothetical protein
MSGGSFDYAYQRVSQFADELDLKIGNNQVENDWGYQPNYSAGVILRLKSISLLAELTSSLMKEVEWLYSGDTGEESFLKRLDNIESNFSPRFEELMGEYNAS